MSRYMAKSMNLEKPKRIIFWHGGSSRINDKQLFQEIENDKQLFQEIENGYLSRLCEMKD